MQHTFIASRRGFTLAELLTAVIIVTVLVVIAAPLYEKTIERSHLAEMRQILTGLQEAKLFAMDKMEIDQYDASDNTKKVRLDHLNVAYAAGSTGDSFSTRYFTYSLKPGGSDANTNGVCAVRSGGENSGTIFYYYRDSGSADHDFVCKGAGCEDVYGLTNSNKDITCS